MPEKFNNTAKHQPRGNILLFTLLILILMSLMASAVILSSRAGLNKFDDDGLDSQAYLNADLASQITALVSRAMLSPKWAALRN